MLLTVSSARVATILTLALAIACGSDGTTDPISTATVDTSVIGPTSDAGARSDGGAGALADAATARPDAGGKDCAEAALDQAGCACGAVDIVRTCYPGPAATQNQGVCRDGQQRCLRASGEFGLTWSACTGFEVPRVCSMDIDAHCTGKVGCDDPECAAELNCEADAGKPACVPVSGQNGNVTLPDGSMFCEGDLFGGGAGGILGGLLGP